VIDHDVYPEPSSAPSDAMDTEASDEKPQRASLSSSSSSPAKRKAVRAPSNPVKRKREIAPGDEVQTVLEMGEEYYMKAKLIR
jgi:hypothetical protein